jgi:hypothetical protein
MEDYDVIETTPRLLIIYLTAEASYAFNFAQGKFCKMSEDNEESSPRACVIQLLGGEPEFPILLRFIEGKDESSISTLPIALLTAGIPVEAEESYLSGTSSDEYLYN